MKTLAELQAECADLGLSVTTNGKSKKDDYIAVLRDYRWQRGHPDELLPAQTMPMLLSSWEDLDDEEADQIEEEGSGWIVQEKLDGVRALLHVEQGRIRITSRCVSEVTYRLSEFQDNLPHLTVGLSKLTGTILDGELACPVAEIDTGTSVTAHSLQATVAIIATSPAKAQLVQERHGAHLRFHVFDILRFRGSDVSGQQLYERLDHLHWAREAAINDHLEVMPSFVVGKVGIHQQIIDAGGEGTVWKKADQPYQAGRRVRHWLKRKRGIAIDAFVSDFKPGTPERGNADLVGAIEFSQRDDSGRLRPVAWVCGWSDTERRAMTDYDREGNVQLRPAYRGRAAVIEGQAYSPKSGRLQHARIVRWQERGSGPEHLRSVESGVATDTDPARSVF